MTKSSKSIIALIALSLASAGFVFAAADKAPAESKAGKCCAAAAKDGKTCDHKCCVAAAKEGNNCTKCGGAGKIEKKK